ncbi:hypothetical protein CEP54_012318 [Fusarium duplospermum]|uniref:Uncharacterized protein n=1 Tax=Fusarium duplospermum TaxID=1325734 RepID=A0A428P9L0_9HYPO|nr:hypothetical protein CEP54_012318 [Fusarium duplospermum]
MSRVPRSVEDGQFDSKTGNPNEPIDSQAIMDQLERLTAPTDVAALQETLPEGWRKDNIKRILTRLAATTSDMEHFLANPQTARLLSRQGPPEQLQRDYAVTKERVNTLKMAVDMAKEDIQELTDSYIPGVDADALGDLIVKLKTQVQGLEAICNSF